MSPNVPVFKRSLLALALASGKSGGQVAEEFGISRKTVQRQLAKPEFRQLVAKYRDDLISTALNRMANSMTEAVDVLAVHLKAELPTHKLRAARAIVTLGLRLRDSVDLTNRIETLESDSARREQTS